MTQVNPEINIYNGSQAQTNSQPAPVQAQRMPQVRIPAYYAQNDYYEPKTFKETLKEMDPMGNITPFFEHPIAVIATWLGLGVGIDAYAKANRGKYEGTLVRKAAHLGDRIEQSKFIQSKPSQVVLDGFRYIKGLGSKALENSAVLRAMRYTPSMPEWAFVKSAMMNQKQEVVQDFIKIVDTLKLDTAEAISMCTKGNTIDITEAEKEMLKKVFKVQDISTISDDKVINQVLLKRLGRSQAEINKIHSLGDAAGQATKREILKDLGLTVEDIKNIKLDDSGKYISKVQEAVGRVKGRVRIGAGQYKTLGPYLSRPFSRSIGCDEVFNKLNSMSEGAKTGTGRALSKIMQMTHRGFTWGGGKLAALLFISPMLVEVGKNVMKADNSEKVSTAANGFVESISWVFTFPLALKLMHSVGGIQYAGMTKDQVEQIREIRKAFNKKNAELGFKTKAEYDKAREIAQKQIDKIGKIDKPQNLFTKILKKAARFMTVDLGRFDGYKESSFVKTWGWNKIKGLPRNLVGVPMRFAIWMGISGVLGTMLSKGVQSIFGKYRDQMKEDEKIANKKQQKEYLKADLDERLYMAQMNKQLQRAQQMKQPQSAKRIIERNNAPYASRGKSEASDLGFEPKVQQVKEQVVEEKVDNYTYIPSSENIIPHPVKHKGVDNYSYIPSSECTLPKEAENASSLEKQRKYIPSQAAANIQKTFDNSGIDAALNRAQRAEEKALRVLAGNFEGI